MDETPNPPNDPTPPGAPPDASATSAAPAAPTTPWEGPAPDAVAWLLVNWHNKHPLARRIHVQDVHTVGAVALPFLAQPLPKEPSLEAGSAEPAAEPAAAPKRRWPWQRAKAAGNGPRRAWSESFIPGLKPDQVAAMALDHGFTTAPDELPLRRVDINNSELESGGANQSGAWPMELVLLSAAIDAGPARTRVLIGRRDKVLGKRALDPIRLGAVAGVAVLLLALLTWALWPSSSKESEEAAAAAAAAASAASAASAAASTPEAPAREASAALAAASEASAPAAEEGASAPAEGASEAASAPAAAASAASAAASGTLAPNGSVDLPFGTPRPKSGRPSLHSGVERAQEEQLKEGQKEGQKEGRKDGQKDASKETPKEAAAGAKPGASAASAPTEAEQRLNVDDVGLGQMIKRGAPGDKLVALVSLPQKTKPEAEAQLAKMQEMIGQTLRGGNTSVNGAVFQTKEGWRAAVWPFGSREEAQLINATLLARGMRARAVDF